MRRDDLVDRACQHIVDAQRAMREWGASDTATAYALIALAYLELAREIREGGPVTEEATSSGHR